MLFATQPKQLLWCIAWKQKRMMEQKICLYEMLYTKELKPSLNVQSDLIWAKLFSDD